MLKAMTIDIVKTYSKCNSTFNYKTVQNPKRILTKPSKGVKNGGFDNQNSDYILCVHDFLGEEEGRKYLILDLLGQGTFGQVVKCKNTKTGELFAVKVIKNSKAYFNQSMMEVTLLEMLNQKFDPNDQYHITRMKDTFVFRKHLCIVFELMSINLYELLKQNQFKGLSLKLIKIFLTQLLETLCLLHDAKIIHCDLKPENILLKSLDAPNIKVIDFGSACHEHKTVYTYIQSRFYRCPEVLLGVPYSSSIDMWSLGCIAAELFLGLPIFPGTSEYNQISRIVNMIGMPPNYMIENGKNSSKFFEKTSLDSSRTSRYLLKSMDSYCKEFNVEEKPSKRYFQQDTLKDIIMQYPFRKKNVTSKDLEKEMQSRVCFCDFVHGLLKQNPLERWTPYQAKRHPFLTGDPFTGPFVPPMSIPPTHQMLKRQHEDMAMETSIADDVMSDEKDKYYLEMAQRRMRANTLGNLHQVPSAINMLPMPVDNQIPSGSMHQSGRRFQLQELAHLSSQQGSSSDSNSSPNSTGINSRRTSVMNYAASVFGDPYNNGPAIPFMSPVETPLNESLNNMDISGADRNRQHPQQFNPNISNHNPYPFNSNNDSAGPSVIPGSQFAQRLQTYVSNRRQSNPAHMFYWANQQSQQMFPSQPQKSQQQGTDNRFFPAYKFPSQDSFYYPDHQQQQQQAQAPPQNQNRLSHPDLYSQSNNVFGQPFYQQSPSASGSTSRLSSRRQSSMHFTPNLSSPLSTSVSTIPEHQDPAKNKDVNKAHQPKK